MPKGVYVRTERNRGHIPWNKGLTKETDERILAMARDLLGKPLPLAHRLALSESHKGQHSSPNTEFQEGFVPWNKGKTKKECSQLRGGHSKGTPTWNKGLTKETDKRVKKNGDHRRRHPEGYFWGIDWEVFGWTKELRQKIRNRDEWKCLDCGITQSQLSYCLVVHHIDGDRFNNSENNLMTLCRKCHPGKHAKRDEITGKFKRMGETSVQCYWESQWKKYQLLDVSKEAQCQR